MNRAKYASTAGSPTPDRAIEYGIAVRCWLRDMLSCVRIHDTTRARTSATDTVCDVARGAAAPQLQFQAAAGGLRGLSNGFGS